MIGSRVSLFILDIALVNVLLGFVPFAIGAYFGLGGVLTLGLVRTSMLRNDKLICLGVYKLVRHPQYFGVSMLHLGFALILGSIYNLVYSPFMFLAMYLKASIEEKYLKRVFGTEYEECFRDVPMFIPRLKKP